MQLFSEWRGRELKRSKFNLGSVKGTSGSETEVDVYCWGELALLYQETHECHTSCLWDRPKVKQNDELHTATRVTLLLPEPAT